MGFWPSDGFLPAAGWAAGKSVWSRLFGSLLPTTLSLLQVCTARLFFPNCLLGTTTCMVLLLILLHDINMIQFLISMEYPIKPLPCLRATAMSQGLLHPFDVLECKSVWSTKTLSMSSFVLCSFVERIQ